MALAGRASEQIALRLPVGMRDIIREIAEANGRSANSEIIMALKAHVAAAIEKEKSGTTA
ncbi:Arc-like DNA binding domain protein [compost metagenome]